MNYSQFLGRQRRLKQGEGGDEKWVEIDETLNKFDQKLRDSGRPDHGTKKVLSLCIVLNFFLVIYYILVDSILPYR